MSNRRPKHICATQYHLVRTEQVFKKMFREDALAEQRMRCIFCKERITRANATADHLVARKNGGQTVRKNIRAACKSCNSVKGHMSAEQFRDMLHSPSIPSGIGRACAWVRFRLNRRVEKAHRRICRAVGMVAA